MPQQPPHSFANHIAPIRRTSRVVPPDLRKLGAALSFAIGVSKTAYVFSVGIATVYAWRRGHLVS